MTFFLQEKADYISALETPVSELLHAAEAGKTSKWLYLAPETSDEQQRFSQGVQQFLETVVMVVEAVPKSYGTDDVRNSTINFVVGVKWLSWRKQEERKLSEGRLWPGGGWSFLPRNKGQDKRKQPQVIPEEILIGYEGKFLHLKGWQGFGRGCPGQ